MAQHTEVLIRRAHTVVAARDYGGDGPPVLLLHGAGAALPVWDTVAPRLTAAHRVVAMDLRGHGRSGDAPWDEEAALDDVAAVADHYGFDQPAVVGHSLGGMLAGKWGARHPDCPAAISLDGHRSSATYAENYVGLEPEALRRDLAELEAGFTAQAQATAEPLTAAEVERLVEAQCAAAAELGTPVEAAAEIARRGLVEHDGAFYVRPTPDFAEALRRSPGFIDAVPDFWRTRCPFLIVVATRDLRGVPAHLRRLMAAFRRGLRRDLHALAGARPGIEVHEIDASHAMVGECPEEVARIVHAFLTEARPSAGPGAEADIRTSVGDPRPSGRRGTSPRQR